MSHPYRHFAALLATVAFTALLGIAVPGSAPRLSAAQAMQATQTPVPAGPIPCDPRGLRTINPRVVEQGGEVEVSIHYTFNCTVEDRRINFFLVVENTESLRGTSGQALDNVKDGLINFVNQVNFSNGSKGGLALFASQYTNRVPLRGGAGGKQALLDAISRISVEPAGNSSAVGAAVWDALGRLPTGVEDPGATNVLFLVDAGAQFTDPPGISLGDACRAARSADVHFMVVGLENAGYRLAYCATNGRARHDPSPDAGGFPTIAAELAEDLVKGQQADSAEVFESLSPAVRMQPNAQPFDPPWTFTGNPPPTGQDIRYRLKIIDPGIENEIFAPVLQSDLTLFYGGGQYGVLKLPKDDICVYKIGDPSFCNGFPPPDQTPTSTPDVGTPTTPTATQTPDGSTPTATDVPVVTPSETATATGTPRNRFMAYLPAAVMQAPLGEGG